MGFKSKIFGFVAAAGLTMSLIAGVAAAPQSAAVSGEVELKSGFCGVNLSSSNGDFGEFTWMEDEYVRTGGNAEMHLTGQLFAHEPDGTCSVTVGSSGLSGTSGIIPSNNFEVTFNGTQWVPLGTIGLPGSVTFPSQAAGPSTVGLKLVSVPDNFLPDTYDGTINVLVANAS